jgi:hypothetical protein
VRANEQNTLRADIAAGRLMKQVVHQCALAYMFSPNAYSFEALSAAHRLHQQLKSLLHSEDGETSEPQQLDLAATMPPENTNGIPSTQT